MRGTAWASQTLVRRAEMARAAMEYLAATVALLRKSGYPSEIVSAGGTRTA